MSTKTPSKGMRAVWTGVAVLAALFAAASTGCSTKYVPRNIEGPAPKVAPAVGMPAPGTAIVAPRHTGV
jgi:hypothetical protein